MKILSDEKIAKFDKVTSIRDEAKKMSKNEFIELKSYKIVKALKKQIYVR